MVREVFAKTTKGKCIFARCKETIEQIFAETKEL